MRESKKIIWKIITLMLLVSVVLLGSMINHITAEAGEKNKTISWNVYSKTGKTPMPTVRIDQVKQKKIHKKKTEYSFVVKNYGADRVKKAVYTYEVILKVPVEEEAFVVTPDAVTRTEEPDAVVAPDEVTGTEGTNVMVTQGAVVEPENPGVIVTPDAVTVSEGAIGKPEDKKYKITSFLLETAVKDIQPGECSRRIQLEIPLESEQQTIKKVTLRRMELYSGNARTIHNYKTGREKSGWAGEDRKAPVIYGFVNTDSVNKNPFCKDVLLQIYSDRFSRYPFQNYIKVVDDRAGVVKVQLDFSAVDFGKEGFYKLRISAQDEAGNTAKTYTWIQLLIPGSAEAIVDDILPRILRNGDSDVTKARAIYRYIRGNCHYSESGGKGDFRRIAANALRYRSGDCYSFYSMARLLCVRAEIPCISITREGGYHHWWDLVYVNGGWYHFDTTPRAAGGSFCLMTDGQMAGYSREGANPFTHTKEFYPKVSERVISPNP